MKKTQDRNFDSIATKFQQNIYNTTKGRLRQFVLQRDLLELPDLATPATVLDVGGGQGQLALFLAEQGHRVLLTDISAEMLTIAQAEAAAQALDLEMRHCALQELHDDLAQGQLKPFPVVLCHAVLEWLADPALAISQLYQLTAPGGVLSLMFYNKDAKRFSNIVYGNFNYVLRDLTYKKKVSLSPQNPLEPADVLQWCLQAGFILQSKTGVRCFHDYLRDRTEQESQFELLLQTELRFNRQEPYASLGRYQHLVLRKPLA